MLGASQVTGKSGTVESFDRDADQLAFATKQVSVKFAQRGSRVPLTAVNDVSLSAKTGETLALVGESGSGKTTLGRVISGLNRSFVGSLELFERSVEPGRRLDRELRRRVQVVFQDPSGSLDPRQSVISAIAEPLIAFGLMARSDARTRAAELLTTVGLDGATADRLPHQISGGQRQRVAIARAIASNPDILVLDEPVSALDVSVQAQIVNLLLDLQDTFRMTYLLISHDLSVVKNLANRVAVMYRGAIIETGTPDSVLKDPRHPYTQALISAIPGWNRSGARIVLRDGQRIEQHQSDACPFLDRCWLARITSDEVCTRSTPQLKPVTRGATGHIAACHLQDSSHDAHLQYMNRTPS